MPEFSAESEIPTEETYTSEQVREATLALDEALRKHKEAGKTPEDIVENLPISVLDIIRWDIKRLEALQGDNDAA